ncbi:atrial natriuretic peptide receptor 2 isoform X2 [Astyanax mexicanus]|uniref:atrial natriuretic peptide receptor 2 isoform X2 n=1 Tax=Astyanax mexicanus TaxID=7994 RepID=UPI0020CAAB0A|nr:atrial natriuretic peptide receptor 2 isoform X2 [Astyanax mexicanus]
MNPLKLLKTEASNVKGIDYLHCSALRSHGCLSSFSCVVDSPSVLKVPDFGLSAERHSGSSRDNSSQDHWTSLLWRAPEILKLMALRRGMCRVLSSSHRKWCTAEDPSTSPAALWGPEQ